MPVVASSKPHGTVICTDGSVTRDRSVWGFTVKQGEDRSVWGFTVKQGERTVHEDSGAHRVTTSSLTMDHGGRSSHTCNAVASLPA